MTTWNNLVGIALRAAWFVAALCASSVASLGAGELTIGSGSGEPGTTVHIPVTLRADGPVLAAQFDIVYPTDNLSSDGAVLADAGTGLAIASREISPGTRRVLIYSRLSQALPAGQIAFVPFNLVIDASPGTVNLSLAGAVLSDEQFLSAAPVTLTAGTLTIGLEPASPRFTSVQIDAAGIVQLELSGRAGRGYAVETSTNLVSWTIVSSGAALNGVLTVTDTNAVRIPFGFYRARLQP